MNEPKKIVLHCAATPDEGDSFGAAEIDQWHKRRGWNGIGYHWVIRRTGLVEKGRSEKVVPASVVRQNVDTLAICLIGTKRFERVQYLALFEMLFEKMDKYNIGPEGVVGHYELSEKDCPGIDMTFLRMALKGEL